jgi:hypothetical protein
MDAPKGLDEGWGLRPGDTIKRTDLHAKYGGSGRGGIGPSRQTPNVLIFSDPATGEQHGYFDRWMDDGCFHYTGEGQHGDQQLDKGNAAILHHKADGRALRLFRGTGGLVEYIGEFEIDNENPWYQSDAPETGGGPIRAVIVFRLRPVDSEPASPAEVSARARPGIAEVPLEQQWTEKTVVDPDREPYEAERREAKLVLAFRDYLQAKGHTVTRLKIVAEGEAKPMFTDLYDKTANLLVEAKGTVERGSFRMAIGQLADYRRFAADAGCAILLPSRPRTDLMRLASTQRIALIWPTGDGFHVHQGWSS